MSELFWFSNDQWRRIKPLLPTNTRGMPRVDDRRILSGIVHVLKSGCHWSDCPPAMALTRRSIAASSGGHVGGIWEDIFAALAGSDGLPDTLMIDSTILRRTGVPAAQRGV